MQMKRPFTKQEMKVMDSEWEFEHPGGDVNEPIQGLSLCMQLFYPTLFGHFILGCLFQYLALASDH